MNASEAQDVCENLSSAYMFSLCYGKDEKVEDI